MGMWLVTYKEERMVEYQVVAEDAEEAEATAEVLYSDPHCDDLAVDIQIEVIGSRAVEWKEGEPYPDFTVRLPGW